VSFSARLLLGPVTLVNRFDTAQSKLRVFLRGSLPRALYRDDNHPLGSAACIAVITSQRLLSPPPSLALYTPFNSLARYYPSHVVAVPPRATRMPHIERTAKDDTEVLVYQYD
jgi:hypothetical protein